LTGGKNGSGELTGGERLARRRDEEFGNLPGTEDPTDECEVWNGLCAAVTLEAPPVLLRVSSIVSV